ncbi:MAG: Gfo/Idh/MocA family oxidoreductase [Planctomycetales bacterium]|nr:Gfo/Idh/MocA family oxidoreductase [Planctomycetales bacterium]
MTDNKIKVGVITNAGGAHVGAYLQGLAASPECEQVVLADADGTWEKPARDELGEKLTAVYRDYGEMLRREQPQLALVTIEARLAPPVIEAALEQNCHVFAEKPSCVRVDDFARLVDLADRRHRYLMLALANRTNPEMQAARGLIAEGKIGRVFGVEAHIIADQTRLTSPDYHEKWYAQKSRAGGGHLIWLGIHWLDLTMYVTGSSIDRVSGFTANVGGQPLDVEDSAVAALSYDGGFLGAITSGYYLDRSYHSHIKVWGSDGWLLLEPIRDQPLRWYSNSGATDGEVVVWPGEKEPRGYTPFVRAAVAAVADMTDPPISNADSLRALRTVYAIYEAAETGRTVTLE